MNDKDNKFCPILRNECIGEKCIWYDEFKQGCKQMPLKIRW